MFNSRLMTKFKKNNIHSSQLLFFSQSIIDITTNYNDVPESAIQDDGIKM